MSRSQEKESSRKRSDSRKKDKKDKKDKKEKKEKKEKDEKKEKKVKRETSGQAKDSSQSRSRSRKPSNEKKSKKESSKTKKRTKDSSSSSDSSRSRDHDRKDKKDRKEKKDKKDSKKKRSNKSEERKSKKQRDRSRSPKPLKEHKRGRQSKSRSFSRPKNRSRLGGQGQFGGGLGGMNGGGGMGGGGGGGGNNREPRFNFDSPPKAVQVPGIQMHIGSGLSIAQTELAPPGLKPEVRQFFLQMQMQKTRANAEIQSSKCDRKLYVGNLPPGQQATKIQGMVNSALKQLKVNIDPGDSCVNMWIGTEGNFGFAEFRSPQDASRALDSLQKVALLGCQLKVGRPSQYQKNIVHIESEQTTKYNIASGYNASGMFDIQSLLQSQDGDPTALQAGPLLDISPIEDNQIQLPRNGPVVQIPTRILILSNMIGDGELIIEEEFKEIEEDINEECSKHGKVVKVTIPRPSKDGEDVRESGKIFVEYETIDAAKEARRDLNGRLFSNRTVQAQYYAEENYAILNTPIDINAQEQLRAEAEAAAAGF